MASARAMHRRCCWPPDSASADSCSRSLTSSQSAACRRLSSTRSAQLVAAVCAMPLMRGPKATFSKIDFGNGFDFWNTMPTRRRSATTSSAGRVDVLAVDQRPCPRRGCRG